MPENLSSIMGGTAPATKKLKKVGDHWEDEQGNQFADEAGTQPIKSEGEQAKAGASAQSVMGAFGMEKSTGTAGWAVGQGEPAADKVSSDWQTTPTDQKTQQSVPDDANLQEYMQLTYPNGLHADDQKALKKRWDSLSQAEKETWLQNARKKKGSSSSMMEG